MRVIRLLALLAGLLTAGVSFADEASKAAKIQELLRLTNTPKLVDQMLGQIEAAQKAQADKLIAAGQDRATADALLASVGAIVRKHLNWESMRPGYAKLYADTFSEDEIDGMLAFYKTPAGQAVLTKMPALMQSSMQLGMKAMQDAGPEMQKAIDEVKAKYRK